MALEIYADALPYDLSSQQSLLESLIFDTGSTPSSFGQMATETPLSQSNDVLGIPYDCDPSIWKDFVESSLWHGQPQEDSTARMHTSLMEYFKNFVAPTVKHFNHYLHKRTES